MNFLVRILASVAVSMPVIASVAAYSLAAPHDGWHAVNVGFAPQVLLGHGQSMWAAGAEESIAVSADGGQHWTVKHSDAGGALLLTLHFVDEKFGYAAGTGGTVLFTRDGGETWSRQKLAEATILQAAFGDSQHGVIRTISALLSTTDSGKTCHPITPLNDPDWQKKFPYTDDLAALDKNHIAVRVSEGEYGDGEYLWTADGGTTWSANYIPSTGIHDLIAANGAYWSFGHEVLGKDKPGGGYSAPIALHSDNGVDWVHAPLNWDACHWHGCGGCTAQGCFAAKDAFISPGLLSAPSATQSNDSFATFPSRDNLSSQWALSGQSLCMLSQSAVECTTIKQAEKLDTQNSNPDWEARSFSPLGAPQQQEQSPQCIRCQLPPMFITKTGDTGPVDMQINFTLEPSGQPDNVAIVGKIPQDVDSQIRAKVAGWLFEPVIEKGKAAAKNVSMHGRLMIMNPEKAGAGMRFPTPR